LIFFFFKNTLCQEFYDGLRSYKSEDGRNLCENFIRLSNKRFFIFFLLLKFINKSKSRSNTDYYNSIKDPIDLTQIQEKIHSDEYSSFEQFLDDIELLLNNAKDFYRVKIKI